MAKPPVPKPNPVVLFIKQLLPVQLLMFYIFFTSGLIVNFLQLLTAIFVWPFNKRLYRKLNTLLATAIWSELTAAAQYWSGSTNDVFISDMDASIITKEHSIVIMNHKYDIDWLIGWIACQRMGILGGSKIVGKSSLKLIPVIGWCWVFTESIFIKRQWESDNKTLVKDLDSILKEYPDDYYFNILLFCEGTRFTKKKHEESMKIAKEKGLQLLKHHLLPRTKGFTMLVRGAENRIGAVYDLNVGIEHTNGVNPDLNAIRLGYPLRGEMLVRRFPIDEIPKDDEGAAAFVHKFYQDKDEIYDTFVREGTFASLESKYGVRRVELPVNYYDFYIVCFWVLLLCTPLFYFLFNFIHNATLLMNLVLLALAFLAHIGIKMFVGISQSDKGSEYGLKSSQKKDK